MRLHKPIGIYLLMWPVLWALWIAAAGVPNIFVLIVFLLGMFIMRSAGCIINDFADRHIDGKVARTKDRPLAAGDVSTKEALLLFFALIILAFCLVLTMNSMTILLSVVAVVLAIIYPFTKRITHLPQLFLGAAFAWAVPMAFAAQTNTLPASTWLVFSIALLWPVIYDTFYAMVDREDDLRIGVKSIAILMRGYDRALTAIMQIVFIGLLVLLGIVAHLNILYFICVGAAAVLCIYQQVLIKERDPKQCFKAFLNNNYIGLILFLGIALNHLVF